MVRSITIKEVIEDDSLRTLVVKSHCIDYFGLLGMEFTIFSDFGNR